MKKFTFIYVFLILMMVFSIQGMSQVVDQGEEQVPLPDACMGFGVFANTDTQSIQMIDTATMTVSEPYLKGMLDKANGGLLDVVITSDGKTALVSNFGESKIFSLDISGGYGVEPTILGSQHTKIFAEDLAITPDDKYVMVTDGGLSSTVVVIEISSMRFVLLRNLGTMDAQSISIHPDGQTVIVADYLGGKIHTLLWDKDTEDLRPAHSYRLLPFWPLNTTISPDGKTIIASLAFHSKLARFYYISPGVLGNLGTMDLPANSSQNSVFSKDGTKLYYQVNNSSSGFCDILVFDVTGPGEISYTGTSIPVRPFRGTGQFFGIETLQIDPSGTYLFMTNPSSFGYKPWVSVIDLATNTQVANLPADGRPTGIAFTCPQTEDEAVPETIE